MKISLAALNTACAVASSTFVGFDMPPIVTRSSDAVPELTVVLPEAAFDAAPWHPGDSASAHWAANDIHPLAA